MTGIAPSVWADEGERAVVTAIALLEEAYGSKDGPTRNPGRPVGPRMSG